MKKQKEFDREHGRSRNYELITYTDNRRHNEINDYLRKLPRHTDGIISVVGICHDKDLLEDGSQKKEHYHWLLNLAESKTIPSLCKKIGLEENLCQCIINKKASQLYLVHYAEADKYRYPCSALLGNSAVEVSGIVNGLEVSADQQFIILRDELSKIEGYVSINAFTTLCSDMGYFRALNKYRYWFMELLKEHNAEYL